jgi:hypothetical protein
MKKSAPKKSAAKKPAAKKPSAPVQKPLIAAQPQSKKQAASQAGMFLTTDDSWSASYFNTNDLHCLERELFG